MNGFGVFLVLAGAALVAWSRLAARVTDPLNQRITGRPYNDRRAYVLVGVGFIILGVALLAGLA
jgi:hypothetical protein